MNTKIAYKLFKLKKDGTLHPLYVDCQREMPLRQWLKAEAGEQTERGKVKSKLGELAYRPGFHTTALPLADHIGKRMQNGELCQASDTVWCEVEMLATYDYTDLAQQNGANPRDQYLKEIPTFGYYKYKTNPAAVVDWYICGQMKINRILTDEQVKQICSAAGVTAQITEKEYHLLLNK